MHVTPCTLKKKRKQNKTNPLRWHLIIFNLTFNAVYWYQIRVDSSQRRHKKKLSKITNTMGDTQWKVSPTQSYIKLINKYINRQTTYRMCPWKKKIKPIQGRPTKMYLIYEFNSNATQKRNVQNKMSIRYGRIRMCTRPIKWNKQTKNTFSQIYYYHIQLGFDFVAIVLDITCGVHCKCFDLFVISMVSPLVTISPFHFTRPLISIIIHNSLMFRLWWARKTVHWPFSHLRATITRNFLSHFLSWFRFRKIARL